MEQMCMVNLARGVGCLRARTPPAGPRGGKPEVTQEQHETSSNTTCTQILELPILSDGRALLSWGVAQCAHA